MKPTLYSTAPLRGKGLELLRQFANVIEDPWDVHVPVRFYDPDALAEKLKEVNPTFLVVEVDGVTRPVIEACPSLVAIGACRGDPWNVDVAAATEAGVCVLRAPGRNAEAVAELALALALAVRRRIVDADRDVRAGNWVVDGRIAYQRFQGKELPGSVVGVVGFGAVGQAFARLARGLGCRVLAHDPYAPAEAYEKLGVAQSSLEEVLSGAGLVSLHAAVTPESQGMIGAEQIGWMPEGAVLINTARAGLVDQDAMLAALESGRLGGAGLDHFPNEYIAPDHPLTRIPNVVLTPHIGGASFETIDRHTAIIARGIADVMEGKRPGQLVNGDVWDRRRTL